MNDISNELRNLDLKITPSRIKVLELLKKALNPLSAESMYLSLKDENIKINLSTVYRILETYVNKGIVSVLNIIGEKSVLYEYVQDKHHHYLICLKCSQIIALDNCPLTEYEIELQKELSFEIVSHKLIMYGYCSKCKQN